MNPLALILALSLIGQAEPVAPAAPTAVAEVAEADAAPKVYANLMPAMVLVQIQILEDPDAMYQERAPIESLFDEFVRQQMLLRVSGVRVSPEGLILIRDPNLPLKRYGLTEALDAQGGKTRLKVAAVLENHDGLLLEPEKPAEQNLPCLTFDAIPIKPGERIYVAEPTFLEDTLALHVEPQPATGVAVQGFDKMEQMVWWQRRSSLPATPATAVIICNAQGAPVGVALDESLWRGQDGIDSGFGPSIMSDRRISPATFKELSGTISQFARRSVKEIEVQFRNDSRIGQQLGNEEGKFFLYGLLLDEQGRIFVPTDLNRDLVRQIDKVIVRDEDKQVEAQVEGLFREFGAILLRAPGVGGQPAPIPPKAGLPRGKVFYTLNVERRYGKRQEEVEYNRYLDVMSGYKEVHVPAPRKPIQVGDIVLDAEGRPVGFYAPIRRDERDEILARQTRRNRENGPVHEPSRIYLFSEIAPLLAQPKAHFDAAARPMSKREEQSLVWFGAEYQPMTAPLARALEVEGATRSGSRGLLVTSVYPGSPAARLNVKVGDILLSLSVPGTPNDIDLVVPPTAQENRDRRTGLRLWKPQRSYLTAILTLLGEGREVKLRLLQDKKEQVVALKLEKAPDDFDTAPQYDEPGLGLAVRNMTYDVRAVLKLGPEAPGVVVSDVVAGSRAAVAAVRPYEVVTHINGQPVTNVKEFEKLLRATTGRQRVELLVVFLGQSRIVEFEVPGML